MIIASAIVTGYALYFFNLKTCLTYHYQRDQTRGWDQVRNFTSGTVQGDEFEIVMLTLVRTANSRGFLGNKERANVCTTRARETVYYFGKWTHWGWPNRNGLTWLDIIIRRERQRASEYDREPFVLSGPLHRSNHFSQSQPLANYISQVPTMQKSSSAMVHTIITNIVRRS